MAPIAVAFGVLDLTGSASQVGVVVAAQIVPQVLFQLLGGALADRGSRQVMMVSADLVAMICQGLIAALFLTGTATISWLIVLMVGNGIAFAMHSPALVGLIPQVVERPKLQDANSLLAVAQSGAFAMGAGGAGVLVATVGAGWAMAVDAATFGVSALLIGLLHPALQIRSEPSTLIRDLREGWREFTAHRWLWAIVLQFSLVVAAHEGVFAVLGPTVSKRQLGGPSDWGLIAGAFGVGTVCGALLSMRLRVQRPMLVASLFVFGIALPALLLSVPAPVPVIAAGAFIHGVCGQSFAVLWYTALHTRVPPESLSRVSAYDHLGSIALAPVGVIAAGAMLESIGSQQTLWVAAAFIIVPTMAVLCVRDVRTLRALPELEALTASEPSDTDITIVSGLPRSGTSLMMQVLSAGGMPVTSDHVRKPDESNPRGYFEDERVKRLQVDSSWIPQAEGTALKVVTPLLPFLPEGPGYRVIWMERDLEEILASQKRMLERSKEGIPPVSAAALGEAFANQLAKVEDELAQRKIPVLKISHGRAIAEPEAIVEQVRDFLGRDLDREAAASAIDVALHRVRVGSAPDLS